MTNWYTDAMGGGNSAAPLLMVLVGIALIAVTVVLLAKLLPGTRQQKAPSHSGSSMGKTPAQSLDRLFATGDIDEQTYRARRTALTQMRTPS